MSMLFVSLLPIFTFVFCSRLPCSTVRCTSPARVPKTCLFLTYLAPIFKFWSWVTDFISWRRHYFGWHFWNSSQGARSSLCILCEFTVCWGSKWHADLMIIMRDLRVDTLTGLFFCLRREQHLLSGSRKFRFIIRLETCFLSALVYSYLLIKTW